MWKQFAVIMVIGSMVFGVLGSVRAEKVDTIKVEKSPSIPSPRIYFPSPPIRINSDAEFTGMFANRTIWNLEINGTGHGCCLFVGNCSSPFIIKNCYLHNANGSTTYTDYFNNSGLFIYNSSFGTIIDNICGPDSWNGIFMVSSNENILKGNNCSGNLVTGIWLSYSNTNMYLENINRNNNICGIRLANSNSNNISNNNCSLNSNCGIHIQYSSLNTLGNNTCNENFRKGTSLIIKGIFLELSNTNNISNNICRKNENYGIDLYWSKFNTISNCNCSDNFENGIYIEGGSDTNTIMDNTCKGNSQYGILISMSKYNTVTKNQLKGNLLNGIFTWVSQYNRIHHNTFINNNAGGRQARDYSDKDYEKSFWNTSAQGNYWSDWCSPDSNSNGIVDFPYYLDRSGEVRDYFPIAWSPHPSVPEPTPAPLMIISVLLITALVVRLRKR